MLTTIIVIALFVLLLILGLPIAFVFFSAGLVGLSLTQGFASGSALMGISPFVETANYVLVAIPLFILMGQFIFYSGLSKDLYDTAYKWLGRFLGGLAQATITSCAFFAACTGSSMASVGTIGPIALKEMERFNYNPYLVYGSIASAGSLGILIPPSIAFIVYGYICEVPIGELFIAGILPGILLAVFLIVTAYIICLKHPSWGPRGPTYSWNARLRGLTGILWSILLFIVILGGIYKGIFTPTEAGGIGAFVVFAFLMLQRRMTWKVFISSVSDTAKTSCMIFTIFIGAKVFNTFIALSGIPQMAVQFVGDLPLSPVVILMIILAAYVPLGCFIDSLPLFVLTLPIVYPVIQQLGIDPLWFGVLVVLVAQISLITPPVGMNVYVLSGVTGRPVDEVFRGYFVFLIPMVAALMILILLPQISLLLPGFMR